jgi:hypothetical protein
VLHLSRALLKCQQQVDDIYHNSNSSNSNNNNDDGVILESVTLYNTFDLPDSFTITTKTPPQNQQYSSFQQQQQQQQQQPQQQQPLMPSSHVSLLQTQFTSPTLTLHHLTELLNELHIQTVLAKQSVRLGRLRLNVLDVERRDRRINKAKRLAAKSKLLYERKMTKYQKKLNDTAKRDQKRENKLNGIKKSTNKESKGEKRDKKLYKFKQGSPSTLLPTGLTITTSTININNNNDNNNQMGLNNPSLSTTNNGISPSTLSKTKNTPTVISPLELLKELYSFRDSRTELLSSDDSDSDPDDIDEMGHIALSKQTNRKKRVILRKSRDGNDQNGSNGSHNNNNQEIDQIDQIDDLVVPIGQKETCDMLIAGFFGINIQDVNQLVMHSDVNGTKRAKNHNNGNNGNNGTAATTQQPGDNAESGPPSQCLLDFDL